MGTYDGSLIHRYIPAWDKLVSSCSQLLPASSWLLLEVGFAEKKILKVQYWPE